MNGLYIHVPFCTKICGYCDFATVACSPRLFREYVDLLLCEAKERLKDHGDFVKNLQTVYFGGGTPTALPIEEFTRLVQGLEALGVHLKEMREVDLECNPDSSTDEILENAYSLGVNRFSLGIQTFDDALLQMIGRKGSAAQSREALSRILNFTRKKNLHATADLMFWLPGQTLERFEQDVSELAESGIGHVSFYGLSLHPHTVLGNRAEKGEISLDEDLYPEMYRSGVRILQEHGIERYEVSNFARPGEESLHNRNYWKRGEYLGLGPSAHGFIRDKRMAAPSRYLAWKHWVESGAKESGMEVDCLGKKERVEEKIWLSLRTREGLDLQLLEQEEFTIIPNEKIQRWIQKGYLQKNGTQISLCGDGWIWMDSIVEDFLP
ncbi:MAG: radical SAM family heme chaperone HemW [Fibrobacter sp.]|nr:radical SAM family heme chaperone HemW [Fibrobacter sp.]